MLVQLRIWPKMRRFSMIVGCLVFWTYILNDSRFGNQCDSTLECSCYVSACLLSEPLIRRRRERSLFCSISPCYYIHYESFPFFPPIRTCPNMAGPPEDYCCLTCMTLSRDHLAWNSIPPFFFSPTETQFHLIPKHFYLEFVWPKDLLSRENENGSIFTLT